MVPGILDTVHEEHKKIIIFTNTTKEAEDVYELLKTFTYNVLLYTHAMLTEDIDHIKSEWRQDHHPESKPVLGK